MTVSAIKTVWEADGTLLATATGGIYDYDETGRLGINRTTTPDAFDSNELIKPCVLLKRRSRTPDNVLRDDANQYASAVDVIEAWFYEDNGTSNIETMAARAYILTHAKQISGTFQVLWAGDTEPVRDEEMDAIVMRSDYVAQIKKSA